MEQQAYQYQVPQMTYETQTQQIPRTVMVPQTTMETYQYQTQKPIYETKYRTVRVPKTTYEDVEVPYQEQVFEVKEQTVQVPRMTEEYQSYTTYANQTIQEPVQVMVPHMQTVNSIQQINKVVEYARTPVNQYTVAGPSYQQQAMTYQQPQMYAQPTMSYAQPSYGHSMSMGYPGYGYGR